MRELTIAGLAHAGGVDVEIVRAYQRGRLLKRPGRLNGMGRGIEVQRYSERDMHRLGSLVLRRRWGVFE